MIDASGGLLDQDYEMFEQQTPHTLIKHEYLRDSAGTGRWRGGLGVETKFQIGSHDTQLVIFGDGDVEPAFGLRGGGNGSLNSVKIRYPGGEEMKTKSLDLITGVPKGTVYHQVAGGGGGYGDPQMRPAERVAEEIKNDIISSETGRNSYRVAVNAADMALDVETTRKLRKKHNG